MLAVGLLVAGATVGENPVDAEVTCRLDFLRHLGWQVETGGPEPAVVHVDGAVCDFADAAEARASGALTLVPTEHDPAQTELRVAAALRSDASRCAFAMRVGVATRNAVDRLVANDDFRFSAIQTGWIGFGSGGPDAAFWKPTASWGRRWVPLRPAVAIQSFYRRPIRAECGVGRQIAQLATLMELFGQESFERSFDADELAIGTFNKLGNSRSILLGSSSGTLFADGLARKSSALGRQSFSGVPGFLFHVFDASTISSPNSQAQNFVVYDVSADAADALRTRGGFEWFNRQNRALWELSVPFHIRGRRWFQRLLNEDDPKLERRLTARERELLVNMREILGDPFYGGFRVYGHPHGVQPIGWFVVRMLDKNPRTPFRIELGLHNLGGEIRDRYERTWISDCQQRRTGIATASVPR